MPDSQPGGRRYEGNPTSTTHEVSSAVFFRRQPMLMAVHLLRITSQLDGHAHYVTDDALASGISAGRGAYEALCGHVLLALPMICDDGPPCPLCNLAVRPSMTGQTDGSGHRRDGHRLLRRILYRFMA